MKCVPGLDLLSDEELHRDGEPSGHISLQVLQVPQQHNPLISLRILRLLQAPLPDPLVSPFVAFGLLSKLISTLRRLSLTETVVYTSRLLLRPGGSRRRRFRLRLVIRTRISTLGCGYLHPEDLELECQRRPASTSLSVVSSTSKACVSCMTSEIPCTSAPFLLEPWELVGVSKLPLCCSCHEDGGTCDECRKGLNQLVDLWSLQGE